MNKKPDLNLLTEGTVHVWHTKLSQWEKLAGHLHLGGIINPEEQKRADRFLLPEQREKYILQRGITRSILAHYLQRNPADIKILSSKKGKPYLEDSNLIFNISHSKDLLACAVTINSRLGIDIQHIYPVSSLEKIFHKILSPAEHKLIQAIPQEKKLDLFFNIWTAKEAYIKGTGEGFSSPLKELTFYHNGDGTNLYQLVEKPIDRWTIRALSIHSKYKAAVAFDGDLGQVINDFYNPDITLM